MGWFTCLQNKSQFCVFKVRHNRPAHGEGQRTGSRLHTVRPVNAITTVGFVYLFPSVEVFKVLHEYRKHSVEKEKTNYSCHKINHYQSAI